MTHVLSKNVNISPRGAMAARRTSNPEVAGSRPAVDVGLLTFFDFFEMQKKCMGEL